MRGDQFHKEQGLMAGVHGEAGFTEQQGLVACVNVGGPPPDFVGQQGLAVQVQNEESLGL